MEKIEKQAQEKSGRRLMVHTAEQKCRAVLLLWTERRKPGEICRDLEVAWGVLNQWQDRAMEGMLVALQPRVQAEKGVALSPRLAVLLEKKIRSGMMKGLDGRLRKLQAKISPNPREVSTEKEL